MCMPETYDCGNCLGESGILYSITFHFDISKSSFNKLAIYASLSSHSLFIPIDLGVHLTGDEATRAASPLPAPLALVIIIIALV